MELETIKAGVRNLVNGCAEVASGERVLILNAEGKVERELAALVHNAVMEAGGDCESLWAAPVVKGADDLPEAIVQALTRAEKIIFNASINRVLLNRYLKDREIVEIHNYYADSPSMCAPDARFDWRELRRLFTRIEEAFLGAKEWSIRSDAGTDLRGRIAGATDVAGAFFGKAGASLRKRRVFPGEVYSPVGITGTSGQIAVQYINELDDLAWDQPVSVLVRDDRIVELQGSGAQRTKLENLLDEKQKLHGDRALAIDSWHGGMNPSARVPTVADPGLEGARTSTALMHVHLGSQLDTISAGMLRATVKVDGRTIFDHGRCSLFE